MDRTGRAHARTSANDMCQTKTRTFDLTFTSPTSALEDRFTRPFSVGKVEKVLLSAGGIPIQASGETIGGVGVSGAPSGETDENCARAGVAAVEMDLEMASF